MNVRQIIYLVLAIAGLILPLFYVYRFFGKLGQVDWTSFFAAAFANPASSSMTVDLMIILVAFAVWMITEARNLGMHHWWIYLVLLALVSAAFAIPLFLFMRERKMLSSFETVSTQ